MKPEVSDIEVVVRHGQRAVLVDAQVDFVGGADDRIGFPIRSRPTLLLFEAKKFPVELRRFRNADYAHVHVIHSIDFDHAVSPFSSRC